MPYHDHWMWVVSDYFNYLDGRYSVWRLFAQVGESEHRLLTTKLVLFADAILFQMRGVFPTALMYFCLAGVASSAKRDLPIPEAVWWSGQQDSNLRPPAPKAGALPDCAMPRTAAQASAHT